MADKSRATPPGPGISDAFLVCLLEADHILVHPRHIPRYPQKCVGEPPVRSDDHPSLRPNLNLVIVAGSKAWEAVKADAVVFAHGGNTIDCLMLVCQAALWDTMVPRTTEQAAYRAPPNACYPVEVPTCVNFIFNYSLLER